MDSITNFIQKDLLRTLSREGAKPSSQLRPSGIAWEQYRYHLDQLKHKGLIAKNGNSYLLSSSGQQLVAQLTRTNLDLLPQPRLFSLIIIRNQLGEYAMHQRDGEPFRGKYTFPGGAIEYGEPIKNHLDRQLREKLGIKVTLKPKGLVSSIHRLNNEVIAHSYLQVFAVNLPSRPNIRALDSRFQPEWIDANKIDSEMLISDVPEIIRFITHSPGPPYIEIKQTNIERLSEI